MISYCLFCWIFFFCVAAHLCYWQLLIYFCQFHQSGEKAIIGRPPESEGKKAIILLDTFLSLSMVFSRGRILGQLFLKTSTKLYVHEFGFWTLFFPSDWFSPEAEFLVEIQAKTAVRVFLLAIHSHLYSLEISISRT
jgi:hypothetical protein